ncbi:MAG TPA: hypothetical protein VMB03_26985 [Bryobacteraceae bacterium]|nr:hypothetical protein [Bryobacteraceae bacterium]
MRRIVELILIAGGTMVSICSGQPLMDQVNFESGQLGGGLHIIGVSVFSGYSTSAYPQAGYIFPGSAAGLGGDENYGATFSVGWQNHGQNGELSVLYSGTYAGQVRYSNLNAYNQTLSLGASHKLGQKWTFSLNAVGSDMTLAQYLYQPSPLNVITQVPATFDDLAAAVGAGQYTNTQVAALLTGSPILQAPGRSLLLANRVLSYTGSAGLSYQASPRLQVHLDGSVSAGQSLLSNQDEENLTPGTYLMPRTLGANAQMGVSYLLDPLTQVGFDVTESRTLNHFEDIYGTTATVSLGRKIAQRWFLNVHGGGTYDVVEQQTIGTPIGRQVVGGASLGFRTLSNTFLASYDRTGADGYGVAVGTITTASGSWSWRLPGSKWGLSASFGDQQTRNAGFVSLSGWEGSGGVNFAINPHASVTAQYVYMNNAGTYLGTYGSMAIQSVRLSLAWAPQTLQR